jgi:tRNA pseudouridine13 synthase
MSNQQRGGGPRRDNKNREAFQSFNQLGGEYLHCTLYKENKDTMDALNLIARMLKIKSQNFGFSGTKDRRAGTVQRISIRNQRAHNLTWLNNRMSGVKIGDFKHSKYAIQLGQHGGNEFIITLKNCYHYRGANCSIDLRVKMIRQSVELGLLYLNQHGFINYFGLQRFGTHSIGTHELGKKILKGDFESAIEDILHVDPQHVSGIFPDQHHHHNNGHNNENPSASRDDYSRARAIATWKATGDADAALGHLPKRFAAESSIIRHLSKDGHRRDYIGALLSITRGMRQMYLHAYQSYVWNFVASRRWAKYGNQVIEGDLILVDPNKQQQLQYGDDGDIQDPDSEWENFFAETRPLTTQDIKEGKHTIFDIVLPTPGFDVIYPKNEIGEFYKTFMGLEENGALDPYSMRRRQREFSLSGNYRPLISRFLCSPEFAIRTYNDDNEQMYPTDVDIIMHKKAEAERERKRKLPADAQASVAMRWNEFAQNTPAIDRKLQEETRRQREENDGDSDNQRISDTWLETSVDGSSKRIKVARHDSVDIHDKSENGMDLSVKQETEVNAPANPEVAVSDDSVPARTIHGSDNVQPASGEDLPQKRRDEFCLDFLKNSVPDEAVSDAPRSDDPSRALGLDPSATTQDSNTTADLQKASPGLALVTTTDKLPSEKQLIPSSPIAKITIPKFHKISDSIVSVVAQGNEADEKEDVRSGSRIAVILKFQLRSSSYATVLLRELMGSIPDEHSTEPGHGA